MIYTHSQNDNVSLKLIFPLAVGSNFVNVKKSLPGFQRKFMLWPIPVVRGEMLVQRGFLRYRV